MGLTCLGESVAEIVTSRETATISQVPFRQLQEIKGVIEGVFLSHECHAALEQNTKDSLKALLLEVLNTRRLIIHLMWVNFRLGTNN